MAAVVSLIGAVGLQTDREEFYLGGVLILLYLIIAAIVHVAERIDRR